MTTYYVVKFEDPADGSGGIVSMDGAPFVTDDLEWAAEFHDRLTQDFPQYTHQLMELVPVEREGDGDD